MAAQLPDVIVVNGERKDLYSNPLEQYWSRLGKTRPQFCPLPNCRRGYIAFWELKDQALYLRGIEGNYERRTFFGLGRKKPKRFTWSSLFPDERSGWVKATWFLGPLRIPHGNMTEYVDQDYESRFEKEMIVTVDKGAVVKVVTIDCQRHALIVNQVIEHVATA